MTIDEKIDSLEFEIFQLKIYINTYYTNSRYIYELMEYRMTLKNKLKYLFLQKERLIKLNKINDRISE